MNSPQSRVVQAWSADLEASRDVNERQRDAFGMVLGLVGELADENRSRAGAGELHPFLA